MNKIKQSPKLVNIPKPSFQFFGGSGEDSGSKALHPVKYKHERMGF